MQIPVPVCYTHPWPTDLESAQEKFLFYNDRMTTLFLNRDRLAEQPQIATWSMSKDDPKYSSACLLWDVFHVYHLMGTMCWNEGVKLMTEDKDHKTSKTRFLQAYEYFNAITQRVLPSWLHSCRQVYKPEKDGSKTLLIPQFLKSDVWLHWSQMALVMVHRVTIDKALQTETSPSLIAKIAKGGWNLLASLPRTDVMLIKDLFQKQKDEIKVYALTFWARSNENSAENGIHGKRVKIYKDLAKKKLKLIGLETLAEECDKCENTNSSVYFHEVPQTDIENEVLDSISTVNITEKEAKNTLLCCV